MRLPTPVLEIVLAVDFDVLPGKSLSNPAEAGLADKLYLPLALGGFHLLLQEGVDPKWVDSGVGHGHQVGSDWLGACPVGGELEYPTHLGQGVGLTSPMEQEIGQGFGTDEQRDGRDQEDNEQQDNSQLRPHNLRLSGARHLKVIPGRRFFQQKIR